MIIVCLQIRKGIIHYIRWNAFNAYFTWCGKSFTRAGKLTTINTYAIDDIISGVCSLCQTEITSELENRKKSFIRELHGSLFEKSVEKHKSVQREWESPEEKYDDILVYRRWSKLRKIKRKMRS